MSGINSLLYYHRVLFFFLLGFATQSCIRRHPNGNILLAFCENSATKNHTVLHAPQCIQWSDIDIVGLMSFPEDGIDRNELHAYILNSAHHFAENLCVG
jgi:hypothetical protein